jgi:hypothetical protein
MAAAAAKMIAKPFASVSPSQPETEARNQGNKVSSRTLTSTPFAPLSRYISTSVSPASIEASQFFENQVALFAVTPSQTTRDFHALFVALQNQRARSNHSQGLVPLDFSFGGAGNADFDCDTLLLSGEDTPSGPAQCRTK